MKPPGDEESLQFQSSWYSGYLIGMSARTGGNIAHEDAEVLRKAAALIQLLSVLAVDTATVMEKALKYLKEEKP